MILKGIQGLLESKKAMLCLLIFGSSFTGLMTGHLEGMHFAGIVATISTIYCWTAHKVDCESIKAGAK